MRAFHSALADVAGGLPQLTERIDVATGLLQDAAATPGLTVADRALAGSARDRLVPYVCSLAETTALHAEPHEDNVLWTRGGPVLIDFEAACRGPVEWDLAYLPQPALVAFPDRDDEAIARFRAGVSFCVAAWCLANPDPTPAVAEAATVHWKAMRGSWLAQTSSRLTRHSHRRHRW